MWDLVASLQQTLDEAAGLQTGVRSANETGEGQRVEVKPAKEMGSRVHTASDERSTVAAKKESARCADDCVAGVPADDASEAAESPAHAPVPSDAAVGSGDDDGPHRNRMDRASEVLERTTAPRENNAAEVVHGKAPNVDTTAVVSHERLSGERLARLQREGVELSLQLGAERARAKAAVQQNKILEAQLSECKGRHQETMRAKEELEDSLRSARESEAVWKDKARQLEAMVVRLTDEQRQQAALMHDYNSQSNAEREALTRRVEELERTREDADRAHREAVQQLHDEIEHWKRELHQQSLRHDEAVSALERDVSAALRRAHEAENRLLDHEVQASQSLRELSVQLEAAEQKFSRTTSALQSRVATAEASCDSARRDAEERTRHILFLRESLRRASLETEEKCGVVALFHVRTAAAFQYAKYLLSCSRMSAADIKRDNPVGGEVSGPHSAICLGATPACAALSRSRPTGGEHTGASATNGSSEGGAEIELSRFSDDTTGVTSRGFTRSAADVLPAVVVVDGGSSKDAAGALPRVRLERELARLTRENRRLRQLESRWNEEHAQLESITAQHDLLLQMYGQQEETLEDLRSDLRCVKDVYREQLTLLGDEVNGLKAELEKRRTLSTT